MGKTQSKDTTLIEEKEVGTSGPLAGCGLKLECEQELRPESITDMLWGLA